MRSISFLLIPVILLFQNTADCQGEWNLKKDKNGIKVFTRKSALFKFDEIKVESTFDGTPAQLAAVLLDVNDHPQWVYKTVESKLLKAVSPTDIYYYTQVECPWPLQNRDLAVHMTITQNAATKVMAIDIKHATDFLPEKKGLVRIKYSTVNWVLTPLNDKQFKIDYDIQVDPGGSMPAWILNMFVSKGPYESFMKLKEQIKLPKYAKAK